MWEALIAGAIAALIKGGMEYAAAKAKVSAEIAAAIVAAEAQFVIDRAEQAVVEAETAALRLALDEAKAAHEKLTAKSPMITLVDSRFDGSDKP